MACEQTMTTRQINEDPWIHRSEGMKCKTCMWFVAKPRPELFNAAVGPSDPRGLLGRCRRRSPTMSGFPVVWSSDWCGDHKLDEGKV